MQVEGGYCPQSWVSGVVCTGAAGGASLRGADCQRDLPGHWVQGHQPILDIKVLSLVPLQATLIGQARPLS